VQVTIAAAATDGRCLHTCIIAKAKFATLGIAASFHIHICGCRDRTANIYHSWALQRWRHTTETWTDLEN